MMQHGHVFVLDFFFLPSLAIDAKVSRRLIDVKIVIKRFGWVVDGY